MRNDSRRYLSRWGWVALLGLGVCVAVGAAPILDLNSNGISDIWETLYNANGIDPHAGAAGDGFSNLQKATAGLNPFDANSVPRISPTVLAGTNISIEMPGVLGKLYQLQSITELGGTNWQSESSLVLRGGTNFTLPSPVNSNSKFFRIVISDVDSDGDGLNDWEEYQLGLDPLNPYSNGQVDGKGRRLNDYEYVVQQLKSHSLASLLASRSNLLPLSVQTSRAASSKVTFIIRPFDVSTGTGLTGEYYTNSSTIYTNAANFNPTNLVLTRDDPVINFNWGPTNTPNLSNALYTVRWTGQVQPQYSETYVFETRTDDGAKLWVNDQLLIDKWQAQGTTSWTNAIALQAGVRYDIRLEYFNIAGGARAQLYWYSPSQPRQIIPASQLYPASGGFAPGGVTSPLTALAFVGHPFTYTITGANSPLGYDATNLPPGLSVNPTNGVISGIPNLAGNYDVSLTVSNALGTNGADLQLQVIDTGSSVTREVWLGVAGTSVTNIPTGLPATVTNSLGTLEGIQDFGDNYGERIRGYLTAPVTGNYYFWIAANSSAELWISNDGEPANKIRRAVVTKPTLPHQWNLNRNQRSAWLTLQAGQRYYIEILHKAGAGKGDHWSVGWLQDPTGTNTLPAEVVPGYVLSPYVPVPISQIPGTLYTANLLPLPGVASTAVGSATLRVSADGSMAILGFQINNLSSAISSEHLDSDGYLNNPGQLIFDISAASPAPDGTYEWDLMPVGTLSVADQLEIIREGKCSINVHTADYPNGEVSGHFTLATGTATFTPPPAPPLLTDDHANSNAVARFLMQATFGPSPADVKSVKSLGYAGWINNQFKLPISRHLTNVIALAGGDPNALYNSSFTFNTWWQQSVGAPDQLRQRVAFALSEIMVVSENGALGGNAPALSSYYDILLTNAFGNYRDLLKGVTLSPAMGIYLNMQGNDKANLALGTHPNENYAREVMQLFSIGLNRMWPDGTLVVNSQGDLVPTYDQNVIIGYARVFTGWNYYQTNQANKRLPVNWYPNSNYSNGMVLVPTHHEPGTKLLLDNAVLPAAQGSQLDPTSTNFDAYGLQDMDQALDSIFNSPNVGPFICRQLIQRLAASDPSRDYLYRVVQKFNDNGSGVRGDMQAVIKAILLDYEARSPASLNLATYGKQREPLLRATALARALPAPPPLSGHYTQNGSAAITVTTSKPHRLSSSDDVFLSFAGKGAPTSQLYNNVAVSNANTFIIHATGLQLGTYTQSGTLLTVTANGHGLAVGNPVYLTFTSGGLPNGIYTVTTVPSNSVFTATTKTSGNRTGNCLFPKWTGGQFSQSGTNLTFTTTAAHDLVAGNNVEIIFPAGTPSPNGIYRIVKVPNPTTFTTTSPVSTNFYGSNPLILPQVAAPAVRSGTVTLRYNNWNMNYTDSGSSSSLSQTPLDAPTVFNFYYPDYKFQGVLASAGLTTPEFQLTSDTSVVLQMNFISGGIFNNGSNTNGLSSFTSGNGAIMLDIGPWMTPPYTSNSGIPALVDALNSLLCAGELSPASKTIIVNYVTAQFPYTTPTPTQMRDRVRAVLHLIASSPDFIIQR